MHSQTLKHEKQRNLKLKLDEPLVGFVALFHVVARVHGQLQAVRELVYFQHGELVGAFERPGQGDGAVRPVLQQLPPRGSDHLMWQSADEPRQFANIYYVRYFTLVMLHHLTVLVVLYCTALEVRLYCSCSTTPTKCVV